MTGRAYDLQRRTGLPMDRPVFVRDLEHFEKLLKVQIVVLSAAQGDAITYEGSVKLDRKIFLYLADEHFHSITDIDKFYPKQMKLCKNCLQVYGRQKKHSCEKSCSVCFGKDCVFDDSGALCEKCNQFCRNSECFARHQQARNFIKGPKKDEPKKSMCETYRKCPMCLKVVDLSRRTMESHSCGETFCRPCGAFVSAFPEPHLCFRRAYRPKPKETISKFIMFDFETTQLTKSECEKKYKNNPREDCDSCSKDSDDQVILCSSCRRCVNCKLPHCGLFTHSVIFAVAHSVCDRCKDEVMTPDSLCFTCGRRCSKCNKKDKEGEYKKPPCNNDVCGKREAIFSGMNTLQEFGRYLFSESHHEYSAIAHNFKGFDGTLLLQYLVANGITPSVIYQGSKLMYLCVKTEYMKIRCIDSLNFMTMKLAAIPGAMGLNTEVRKGAFPHLMTSMEAFGYRGPYPDPKFYDPDRLSEAERKEFYEWYESVKDKEFVFAEEMLSYTRNDVEILRQGCMKFRDMFMEMTKTEHMEGVDPLDCLTLSSTCMRLFRQHFLTEYWQVKLTDTREGHATYQGGVWTLKESGETFSEEDIESKEFVKSDLPEIPLNGYIGQKNHSMKSLIWLEYIALKEGRQIEHCRNKGEFKPIQGSKITVDGYLPPLQEGQKGRLYDFYGCLYHGHKCIPTRAKNPVTGQTTDMAYFLTQKRSQMITDAGYELITIWECEYDSLMKTDPLLRRVRDELDLPEKPLNIRDSFYGGRVEPFKLYKEVEEGCKIRFQDVRSLYPYINKKIPYPSGHAQIYTTNFDVTLESYFGFIQAKVLAPRELFLPVLPIHSNGKLKFALCRTCCELETEEKCECSDEDRAFSGTWTTEEMKAAMRSGYKLLKIYTVFHYPETVQYDPVTKTGGLFAGYINKMAAMKIEASDWPSWCQTDNDKERYIKMYYEQEGITLKPENICKNAARKQISKSAICSLWGKTAERQNKTKCTFVNTAEDLAKFLNDPTKRLKNFHIINEDVIVLEHDRVEGYWESDDFSNIAVASMTTSMARLHLLNYLQSLDSDALLYTDTDSVLYQERAGRPVLQNGDLLGELADEIPEGTHIVRFVSTGPKSYSYILSNGESKIKIKGITLNFLNKKLLNFDSLHDIVFNGGQLKTPAKVQFVRDKFRGKIYNRPEQKTFKLTFTKRAITNGFNTLPFGY